MTSIHNRLIIYLNVYVNLPHGLINHGDFAFSYLQPAIVQAFILPQGGVRLMIHQSHG